MDISGVARENPEGKKHLKIIFQTVSFPIFSGPVKKILQGIKVK